MPSNCSETCSAIRMKSNPYSSRKLFPHVEINPLSNPSRWRCSMNNPAAHSFHASETWQIANFVGKMVKIEGKRKDYWRELLNSSVSGYNRDRIALPL